MRHQIGYIALSLLAAAVAGCSSADSTPTTSANGQEPLTGELAKFNGQIVPLVAGSGCSFKTKLDSKTDTTGIATITLQGELGVVSLRPVDSALLLNGVACKNEVVSGSVLENTVITGAKVASILVSGTSPGAGDTIIFDFHSGIIAPATKEGVGGITIDLGGDATDQIAFLMPKTSDTVVCKKNTLGVDPDPITYFDSLDLNGDKFTDVVANKFTAATGRITVDLNDGDDSFDQADCLTPVSIYGGAGKDTITVGSAVTIGDVFGGGTDTATTGTATQKVDTITFTNRASGGVTLSLNGIADDGDTASIKDAVVGVPEVIADPLADPPIVGVPEVLAAPAEGEFDNILDDFEVVTGTGKADILRAGKAQPTYTLNGGAGDDILSGLENCGVVFNGGDGTDTVDYGYGTRTKGVSVTIDGTQNDGYVTDKKYKLDNVSKDIENIIGTNGDDLIVGSAGANVIRPGGGKDIVYGGDGNDTFVAGMANGIADTADGDDIFVGGKDTDTVDYSLRTGDTQKGVKVGLSCLFTGTGTATVPDPKQVAAASGVVVPVCPDSGTSSGAVVEKDKIGADVENIIGTIGVDHLYGNSGDNVIWGLGGADVIVGGAGLDQLDGNAYLSATKGYACNPVNPAALTCLDLSKKDCDCSDGLATPVSCTAKITCGDGNATAVGDSLDIASCAGGIATANYNITNADTSKDVCWTIQK